MTSPTLDSFLPAAFRAFLHEVSRIERQIRGRLAQDAAVRDAEVVIEAIVEDVGAKQRVFAAVEGLVSESAVLASNTSSLSIGAIASALAHPERVIGMHFFNPVHLMKLVEVVVADGTSDEARAAVLGLATQMGKEPIVVSDSPGFASSRLGVVLGLEAMRMLEQGVAGADDIDKAMELGYRHPMGPLRVSDLVGLDVRLAIADHLHRELGGDQYHAPEILRAKVQTEDEETRKAAAKTLEHYGRMRRRKRR